MKRPTAMLSPLLLFLMLQGCEPDSLAQDPCMGSRPMYHDPDSVAILLNSILADNLIPELDEMGYSINDCQNHFPISTVPCTQLRIDGDCLSVPLLTDGRQYIRTIWSLTSQPDSLTGLPLISIIMFWYRSDSDIEAILGSITRRFDLQTIKEALLKNGNKNAVIEFRIYCSDANNCMRRIEYNID